MTGTSKAASLKDHYSVLRYLADEGIDAIELQVRYGGVDERSILVVGSDHRSTVEELCQVYKQQCYLESHNDRGTYLVFKNGAKDYVGQLEPVSDGEALKLDAWSYRPDIKQYYATKGVSK
jgi:hypothetical protein